MPAPTLNPAVQYCLQAYRTAYAQTKSTAPDYMANSKIAQAGSIQHQAEKAAEAAYCNAMPTFTDLQSVLDCIACVSHAMPPKIIDKDMASKLLYSAQVALGVFRTMFQQSAKTPTPSPLPTSSGTATPPADSLTAHPTPANPPSPTQTTQTTQETTPPPPPPIRTSSQPNNQHQPQTHQPLNQAPKPTQMNPKNHPPVHPNQKRIPKLRRQNRWKSINQYLTELERMK